MFPVVLPSYARADIAFERGEGAVLWATDGRRMLDFGSGIAVTSLGHCHPHLVRVLQEQVGKLWHTSNLYRVTGQESVATRLTERTFADTVFFCNSGAEANECAIKIARKYQYASGQTERNRVICATGAFHGRTIATLAAGGQEKHLKGFYPVADGFEHVPFGNLNMLRNAIDDRTAAIMVEPVQGEGGIVPATAEYLRGLRAAADEFGLMLIFDEVQTGMGRTGKLFAYEWSGIAPDIMAIAKGLGGGFPVGACLATAEAAKGMTAGSHGSTFGGNPLAMAAAGAVLDVMLEPGFFERVQAMAALLRDGLERAVSHFPSVVEDVRGMGLLLGLKCRIPNSELIERLRANGLLTVAAGDNVVRFLPPLIIRESEIAEALGILERTLAEVSQ